jgi:hypothetical protein
MAAAAARDRPAPGSTGRSSGAERPSASAPQWTRAPSPAARSVAGSARYRRRCGSLNRFPQSLHFMFTRAAGPAWRNGCVRVDPHTGHARRLDGPPGADGSGGAGAGSASRSDVPSRSTLPSLSGCRFRSSRPSGSHGNDPTGTTIRAGDSGRPEPGRGAPRRISSARRCRSSADPSSRHCTASSRTSRTSPTARLPAAGSP